MPVTQFDVETREQSLDGVEKNDGIDTYRQGTKTIEFSPIVNGEEITNSTPETIQDDLQTKTTSFTEKLTAMVEMKPREKEEVRKTTERSKTFGKVSTITTEADQGKDHIMKGAGGDENGQATESKLLLVELEDLMSKRQEAVVQRRSPPRVKKGISTQPN